MFLIVQILVLFLFIHAFLSLAENRILKTFLCVLFSLYLTSEMMSAYVLGHFIDYRVYVHFNLDSIESHGFQFEQLGLLFAVVAIVSVFLTLFLSNRSVFFTKHRIYVLPTLILSLCLMSLPEGVFGEKYKAYEIMSAEDKPMIDALIEVGIDPEAYIFPEEVVAQRGKNIIVISVESLERGFLSPPFEEWAPRLSTLSKEWTYFPRLVNGPGGKWTAGSIYNQQVGMPAFFPEQANIIFQGSVETRLTGLGHVLDRAGYRSTYLMGNPEYAGIRDLLETYRIRVVSEKDTMERYPRFRFGLHDKDLFKEARRQVDQLAEARDKPFALFLSTINSHFPDGIYDHRMEEFIPPNKNGLAFSFNAVDYLISEFIDDLRNKGLLEKTAIFIFPDHLLMGDEGDTIKALRGEDRSLFLMTNIDSREFRKSTDTELHQVELPRLILDGAGIETNAKFLVDFIGQENPVEFISQNRRQLSTLNVSALKRIRSSADGRSLSERIRSLNNEHAPALEGYALDRQRFIAHAAGEIDGKTYTNSLEALDKSYRRGFRLLELDILKTADNHYVAAHDWKQWAEMTNYSGDLPPTTEAFLARKIYDRYTPLDMAAINRWFTAHQDTVLVTDKINEPVAFAKQFTDRERLMMELFSWDAIERAAKADIRAVIPTGSLVESLDEEHIASLKERGISAVAISYRAIYKHGMLLESLLDHGIRIYAYHINDDDGVDETYIVCNLQGIFYGMYADRWTFDKLPECREK